MRLRIGGGVLLGLAVFALLAAIDVTTVRAATFIVEDGASVGDNNPGDGECKSKFRPGTLLRNCTFMAAVEESNALPGNDTILLPAGTFRFQSVNVGDFGLVVTGRTTIVGAGITETNIRGAGLFDSALIVKPGGQLEIRSLTYSNSIPVRNEGGFLIIDNVLIRDNRGIGGGVLHKPDNFNLVNSSTVIANTRITQNEGIPGSNAGGIQADGPGTLTISNSTIDSNFSPFATSGGMHLAGGVDTRMTNVTVSGNRSEGGTGGIRLFCCNLQLENVTIANNIGAGFGMFVGNSVFDRPYTFRNVLFANNLLNGASLNCSNDTRFAFNEAAVTANNLSSDATCLFRSTSTGNILNVNPLIASLAGNNGPTPTHALQVNSPAIDTGVCIVATDQRGIVRPQDGDGVGGAQCDIGAFEAVRLNRIVIPPIGVPILSPASSTVQVGQTFTQTFAWDVPAPTNWGGLGSMDFRLQVGGRVPFWLRWNQVLDTYQLLQENGQPLGYALRPGTDVPLTVNGISLLVGGVKTETSGITGQRATLTLPFQFDTSVGGTTFAVEVSATDDEGRADPYRQVGTIAVVNGAAPVVAPPAAPAPDAYFVPPDDDDDDVRLNETQRHQRSRTNQSSEDDERTEGHVVAIRCTGDAYREVDIANRDGTVTLRLVKEAADDCQHVRLGDYLEADGYKEHELLYYAERITTRRR